jgi:hypothetical protein
MNAKLTTFIRSVVYPVDERSKNGKNVPAPVPQTTRLWWDK